MRATTTRSALLIVLAMGAQSSAFAGETYEGLAYARDGQRLLYREVHWVDGARHLVLYRCPDGKAFARKRLDRAPGAASPDFELVDGRDGYREGVRDGRVFVQTGTGAAPRSAALGSPRPVIDAGFDAFVRGAWDGLGGGRSMAFLVPSRLKALDFDVRQVASDAQRRSFKLTLGAWYGGLLPPIVVDYAMAGRQLLRYRGISNIRSARGGNVDVDIRFPADRRRGSDGAALDAAATAPLDGRCTL